MFAKVIEIIASMKKITNRYPTEVRRWIIVIPVNCEDGHGNIDV